MIILLRSSGKMKTTLSNKQYWKVMYRYELLFTVVLYNYLHLMYS